MATTRYPPIEIKNPEDVATAGLARWGFYGLNGVGKTWFTRSIPSDLPTLVVSADEENVDPLRGFAHIKVAKITRWNQIGDLYDRLQKLYADPDVKSGKKRAFKVIVFDTWTRVQQLARNKIMVYEPAGAEDASRYIDKIPSLPKNYEHWQTIGALAGEWMRNFETLPAHLIFLMQENKYDPKSSTDHVAIQADLTKYALTDVMTTLKLVGRLYVDLEDKEGRVIGELDGGSTVIHEDAREVRKLLVGKHPVYRTKGDTTKVGYVVREPTWEKLSKALLVEQTAAAQ